MDAMNKKYGINLHVISARALQNGRFFFTAGPSHRRRQYCTILQLNLDNLDNHEFKNSTINLRFNAFLKIEIFLLS